MGKLGGMISVRDFYASVIGDARTHTPDCGYVSTPLHVFREKEVPLRSPSLFLQFPIGFFIRTFLLQFKCKKLVRILVITLSLYSVVSTHASPLMK